MDDVLTSRDEELLIGLDADQLRAVTSEATPLCVLAAAGSGKTRVLTRRVAYRIAKGAAEPEHTLVITFTRKAADELRQRLAHLRIDQSIVTGTFHAIALAQLRTRWIDMGRTVPAIASQPLRIVESVLQSSRRSRSVSARDIAAEISWAKSKCLRPQDFEEGIARYRRRPRLAPHQVARIYEAYEKEKSKRRVVDFDDLLLLAIDAMRTDVKWAEAQRWRFRHFFVDEFQDLNEAQFELLRAWLGDRSDLFVVGDPNQAIYGWNGADASFITEIKSHFPTVETVDLSINYRSTPQVLEAARAVLPGVDVRRPDNPDHADVPDVGAPPYVCACADETDEATTIARQIRMVRDRSYSWTDIAVLVRTNAQRAAIETALRERGIPVSSHAGGSWLQRRELHSVAEHFRSNGERRVAQEIHDIVEMSEQLDVQRSMSRALRDLAGLMRQAVASDPEMSIADFVAWVEASTRFDGPEITSNAQSGVTVTTFHRAKGLEWPVVFLAGLEDGLVPLGNVKAAQLEEEQRLFYVAVTRAREELYCTWAARRTNAKGEQVVRKSSPWLQNMQQSVQTPIPAGEADARSSIKTGRSMLGELSGESRRDESDALRSAIDAWRSRRARHANIDPSLIVSDRLLDSIIEVRPTTTQQLAALEGSGAAKVGSLAQSLLDALKAAAAVDEAQSNN